MNDEEETAECEAVPLPIQTFLWRQTNPFLGAKIGKLHEASCVTFERVVVQNILHGLSPSLSDAIGTVSRWRLVRAAFPHVVQCAGSLLEAAQSSADDREAVTLSPSLAKILYIMHWMLLDSAQECIESSGKEEAGRNQALFSIASIQLFVYLIAPLVDVVDEESISSNIRLESGLKIWQALWNYRQPDVLCIASPVKPRRGELPLIQLVRKERASSPTAQGIYLGDDSESKPRRPSIVPPPKPPRTDAAVLIEKQRKEAEEQRKKEELREEKKEEKEGEMEKKKKEEKEQPRQKPSTLPVRATTAPEVSTISRSIVRSVSEYKAEAAAQLTRARMHKSNTTHDAFDVSPTSECSLKVLEEVESALQFVEEHSLSGVFHSGDDAPLVHLTDICSAVSVEMTEGQKPGCQVVCEWCGKTVFREGTVVGECTCRRAASFKLKIVNETGVAEAPPAITPPQATPPHAPPIDAQIAPPLVLTQKPSAETISSCSQQTIVPARPTQPSTSHRSFERGSSGEVVDEEPEEYTLPDPTVATYMDVAVIRSLLIVHWSEPGIHWGMRYILNRLADIQLHITVRDSSRRNRSNSLPSQRKQKEEQQPVPTWADLGVEEKAESEHRLHVAFNDSRRASGDATASLSAGRQSRRTSVNTLTKRERNRSDPSICSSLELLSVREDSHAVVDEERAERAAERLAKQFYPEALGSANFIEKNGKISFTVVIQTINQVMERTDSVRLCELALNIADTLLHTPVPHTHVFFHNITTMLFRIYLSLGCPHGCNEGVKSAQGDFLRGKAKTLVATLEKLQPERFRTLLTSYVAERPPQTVLDLLHAITAFCRSEIGDCGMATRRASDGKMPNYRNRFNEKEKGIEGRIVNATLKHLTTRLAANECLVQPENMSLYQDVRMLINYLQEQHGNPFRRVGLSALLDAIPKNPAATPSVEEKDEAGSGSGSGKSSPQQTRGLDHKGEQASLRRGLFKKKASGQEDSDADSSPSTPRTISSIDEQAAIAAGQGKKKSAPKLHFAFNLLKTVRSGDVDEEGSDSEAAEEGETDFFDCNPTPSRLDSARPSMVKAKSPIDALGRLHAWGCIIPCAKSVDTGAISAGARRFSFLMETARPGSFPDAPLVGALLHLRSPVLARASLLLECCHFVARCNRNEWPEWIRSSHSRTLSLGGPLANRGTPSATRRMHTLQRSAGRHFYHWALQLSEQLSKELDKLEAKPRRQVKMEDVMEDFTDDALVNDDSGERTPAALQMLACLMLQEITAFLRETFRTIPRAKMHKQTPASGWDKLLSHRRWSILSNTFQAQPTHTGSISSIADPAMHLNDRERRISLSTAEEDSPRGSKDTINESAFDKKEPVKPSVCVRLYSRQSTYDEAASGAGSTRSAIALSESGSGRRLTTGRQRLLKRGSPMGQQPSLESSHKRRQASFRRKQSKPANEDSDKDEMIPAVTTGSTSTAPRDSVKNHEESPSDTPAAHARSQQEEEDEHMTSHMPWLKVAIRLANSWDADCTHERMCTARCFRRVYRQCQRMCEALGVVYQPDRLRSSVDRRKMITEKWAAEQQSLRRSLHSRQSAAVPRRESAMVGGREGSSSMAIKALLMEKMMAEKAEKEKEDALNKKSNSTMQPTELDTSSEQSAEEPTAPTNRPMIEYLRHMALGLAHSPLSLSLKGALLLQMEGYKQMVAVSWRLLLEDDPHVVLSAASMFIVSCVRRPDDCVGVIRESLESTDASQRTGAIHRWYALWRNRFHVWLKMEEGAQAVFKVPPPGIDFTLPSPPIGQSQLPVVDPPWMPHLKTKVEQLSLKEEEHATSQTIMTMTRTRRKQKQEMVKRAVRETELRQCEQRQLFHLRGSAIVQLAAYEPALFHHTQESAEEGESTAHATRSMLPVAQPLFPSALLAVVPHLVNMLDDPHVDHNGVSVSDASRKIMWSCLVEDPSLFLRHFLEKLTNRDRQEHLMSLLRKLIIRFNPLPSQAAHSLLNYLFGFVMHYVRAACEGSDKALGLALSLAPLLAPSVHGLYFKDLKQTLKKEQCDQALMITANVPSAKKVIVHGPDSGMGGIPSQFPVHEDTQFQQILTDSLEFFNIEDDEVNCYFLADSKTGLIHMPGAYVRDYYFFHRSFYPQLTLQKMDPEAAHLNMRVTAFNQRFIEVGKVLLTHNILKHSPQHVIAQRIFFLHDELTHLPAFPRKSLESCFGQYNGHMGEQLKAIDAMHKFTWAKLMSDMFEKMENAFMFADLHLFINVVNGIMIMHCEDLLILRRCAATYIAMSIHFNSLFASQGFFLVMPTLLRCYSQRQTNRLFCSVVEFLCKQFYTLHRKPFILQMCGSIANVIDNNNNDFEINPMRVKAKYWFNLLKQMESMNDEKDELDILGLVPYPKPLKALDLCYRDDPNTFCLLTDAIASCICVCAFAPDSRRSHHMLLVMQALLPHQLRRAEEETTQQNNCAAQVKTEIAMYQTLSVEMKALVHSCETLARGPTRTFDLVNTVSERGKSFVADSPQFFDPPTTNDDADKPHHIRDKKSTAGAAWDAAEVEEQHKESYRRPRDTLLCLAATYLEMATPRLKELAKLTLTSEHTKIPDVMDHKCHVKLSEVALALLKIAPYDLATLSCTGLQKYFLHVLPVTDWSIESNRSALNIVLRRLDKTIAKIAKKQSLRRRLHWPALAAWLNGLCDTLAAYPYIAHLHPLKTTAQTCLRIMCGDPCAEEGAPFSASAHPPTVLHPATPPSLFCTATLRLTAILMQALGQFAFSLEQVCGAESLGACSERLEAVLCHLLIPLFLRQAHQGMQTGGGGKATEGGQLAAKELSWCIQLMQQAVSPPPGKQPAAPPANTTLATSFIRTAQTHVLADATGRQGSVSVTDRGHQATVSTQRVLRDSLCHSIYLALKVQMLCCGKLMTPMWPRVSRLVRDLLARRPSGPAAATFLRFLLHSQSPITLMVAPLVHNKLKCKPTCEAEAAWQSEMSEVLERDSVPQSAASLSLPSQLQQCSRELAALKEELACKPLEMARSYTPTMCGETHSDSSAASSTRQKASAPQRRASTNKSRLATMKEGDEGAVMEDGEDTEEEPVTSGKVSKSSSGEKVSSRVRSMSGFGVWRSVRRKSRAVSTDTDAQHASRSGSVELSDLTVHDWTRPEHSAEGRDTLGVQPEVQRQRFVSFSTPRRGRRTGDDDDEFLITEQHHVV